jgi:hypothetical protein
MELHCTDVVQVTKKCEEATPQLVVPYLNLVVIPCILQHTLCLKNHLLPIMKAPLSLSLSLSLRQTSAKSEENVMNWSRERKKQNLQRQREVETCGSGHP